MTDLASRMSPTISVLLPTFNRSQLVQEAIESILKQRTDARFEIIVINDGSADDTEEALQKFRDVIRYVRQENAGLNAARNHGLELATGEYIALLDDDDVWLPFKTSLELAALEKFPRAAFVHSNFFIWKPHGDVRRPDGIRTWYPRPFSWEELYEHSAELELDAAAAEALKISRLKIWCGDTYYWALFAPMVLPSAAIIRHDAIGDLRFPEFDSTCGDWDFFAQLSHRSDGVFVPIETTLNRSHEDPWRLTRIDGAIQLRRRLAFIRRRWRSDPEFMRMHAREVDCTEAQVLRSLAKRLLVNGDAAQARTALRELRALGPSERRATDYMLAMLAHLPFASSLAGALRSLKRVATGPAA